MTTYKQDDAFGKEEEEKPGASRRHRGKSIKLQLMKYDEGSGLDEMNVVTQMGPTQKVDPSKYTAKCLTASRGKIPIIKSYGKDVGNSSRGLHITLCTVVNFGVWVEGGRAFR